MKTVTTKLVNKAKDMILQKHQGLNGVLVTVGLCIVGLLLCVTMKDSLSTFVTTIVELMTTEAKSILGV